MQLLDDGFTNADSALFARPNQPFITPPMNSNPYPYSDWIVISLAFG